MAPLLKAPSFLCKTPFRVRPSASASASASALRYKNNSNRFRRSSLLLCQPRRHHHPPQNNKNQATNNSLCGAMVMMSLSSAGSSDPHHHRQRLSSWLSSSPQEIMDTHNYYYIQLALHRLRSSPLASQKALAAHITPRPPLPLSRSIPPSLTLNWGSLMILHRYKAGFPA